MSAETTESVAQAPSTGLTKAPGELFWSQGATEQKPLRIQHGVVAYRRGGVAIGLLGPGQVALPIPGVVTGGPAAADLVAVTETTATVVDPNVHPLTDEELIASARSVVEGADRLGNQSLPQRLAGLLLDITEMTGQPVVGCRQDILAMVAAARRETVATILSVWREEEWIQTRYRRTKVMDRDQLRRIREKQA